MRAYFQQVLYRLSSSYWFIPTLMVLGAIALAELTTWVDHAYGHSWMEELPFISFNQPEGARALLATVAGSMITVAGVTFSLTILAVSHASTHYGPRLLGNFMRDRGNQVTLGTFIATFLYCLLVLRAVNGATGTDSATPDHEVFVPQLSLLLALLLTLASIAELIYFIHHVPDSMHIATVLQRLASELTDKMQELFPEAVGEGAEDPPVQTVHAFVPQIEIPAIRSGYIEGIDGAELMQLATRKKTVLRLTRRPGDFVRRGEVIAQVEPCSGWDQGDVDRVHRDIRIGASRTPTQDVLFIINEFVEIAVRALSPGVNDPFTAMQCLDRLSAGLAQLSRAKMPAPYRFDKQGNLRIITIEVTYEQFVDAMLRQLIPYVKSDASVTAYFEHSMSRTLEISSRPKLNQLIESAVAELRTAATES